MTRAFKPLSFGLALLAILCYALADGRPFFGLIMVGLGLIGIWLTESRNGRPLPRAAILALVAIALANAAWATVSGRLSVSAFSEFVTYLQVIKLFDRRRARDFAQLLSLAIFQLIGSVLTSNALFVGVIMLAFIPLAALCAGLLQVVSAREASSPERGGVARGRRATRDILAVSVICAVGAYVGGAAAFLFIPRGLGTQRLGEWGNANLGQNTSFTDSVTLGVGGLITESQAEVLDVEITDRFGRNLGGVERIFYLRGAALERYDRGRWTTSPDDRATRHPIDPDRAYPVGGNPSDVTHIARVTLRNASDRSGYLFTLWQPSRITYVGTRGVLEIGAYGVLRRETPPGRFDYIAHSIVDAGFRAREQQQDRSREIISERASDLAEEILRDAGIESDPGLRPIELDLLAAQAIESYLRITYGYTLDILAPRPGRDPIEFFLFDSQQGHCEYFASALAAMCRSVGIRARVVTGYVAAEFNEGVGRYIVRESNAHAWVEAQTAGGRWVTLDATPPADLTRIHSPTLGTLAKFRRFIDAIELAWIDGIVGFDEKRRADMVGAQPINPGRVEDRMADLNMRVSAGGVSLVLRAIRNGLVVSVGLALLGSGLLIIIRTMQARRALRRMLSAAALAEPELVSSLQGAEFFADLQSLLARRGHGRPVWAGALEHAADVESRNPEPVPLQGLVRLYYRARFGRHAITREEIGQANATVDEISRLLKRPPRRKKSRRT
ncbi:MAG: DUF3488 domain-containing protein [Phycisphaeraceae bacterium]|nr:DUF3488 domain-containing protein [Phycisphaeraceae bacterium]MBX3367271.1 DUF3488 domain-containing protein [Phycisphaeraceae bacterium]